MRLSFEEAISRYGQIVNGVWNDEFKWCVSYPLRPEITLLNSEGKIQKNIYCNKDIVNALDSGFKNAIDRNLSSQLSTFDGCFMIRDVRSEPGKTSTHSYACALDFNAATNRLGTNGDMSQELAQCFIDVGFSWGGNFNRKDPMHFSCAWE